MNFEFFCHFNDSVFALDGGIDYLVFSFRYLISRGGKTSWVELFFEYCVDVFANFVDSFTIKHADTVYTVVVVITLVIIGYGADV